MKICATALHLWRKTDYDEMIHNQSLFIEDLINSIASIVTLDKSVYHCKQNNMQDRNRPEPT